MKKIFNILSACVASAVLFTACNTVFKESGDTANVFCVLEL